MVRSPFYCVSPSPWPFIVSLCLLNMAIGLVTWIYRIVEGKFFVLGGIVVLGGCLYLWWRDLLREGDQGYHTKVIVKNFRDGIGIFIVSEAMFFFSFFWAFFHRSLSPNVEVGGSWPPLGIRTPNPLSVPLLNTWLLLRRGAALNYAHLAIKNRDYDYGVVEGILLRIVCGVAFILLQYREYFFNSFTAADGIYGSRFYILTGFHGIHVFAGTAFLIVTFVRLWYGHFLAPRHFGFEACSWYWHFVDVIWIVVYIFVYIWGGGQLCTWWAFN